MGFAQGRDRSIGIYVLCLGKPSKQELAVRRRHVFGKAQEEAPETVGIRFGAAP